MRALLRLACISLPLAATFACGSIDDPGQRKPLAVLQGQLTQAESKSSTPAPASNVRIAVVWVSVDGRGYKSAQDIPAEAVFPSKFRLELTDPPPASAMMRGGGSKTEEPPPPPPNANPPQPAPAPPSGGGAGGVPGAQSVGVQPKDRMKSWPTGFAVAVGAVVAYEDVNGNGKLDLVDEGAGSFIDRVLGANEKLLLVYTEGSPMPADLVAPDGTTPTPGYNLLNMGDECVVGESTGTPNTGTGGGGGGAEPAPGASGSGASAGTPPPCNGNLPGWLPMTTLYDLPLTAEPRFAKIMCKNDNGIFGGGVDSVGESDVYYPGKPVTPGPGPDGKYPAKGDPNVSCVEDGKIYLVTTCTEISQGLCKGTVTSCTSTAHGFPSGSTTAPPDWPCTVK